MNTNNVILTGNLTRDLEVKYAQSGTAYADSAIAVNDKEKAIFVNFRIFGKYAETMAQYLVKGTKVLIQGKLDISEYQGNFYTKILVNSVELLSTKKSGMRNNSNTNFPEAEEDSFPF